MGWNIQVYAASVRENCQAAGADQWEYIENTANLVPFTQAQRALICKHLGKRGYKMESRDGKRRDFIHKKDAGIEVMLTETGLYFSATTSGIFEISMTAGEFATSLEFDPLFGHFCVMDPQNGGWMD